MGRMTETAMGDRLVRRRHFFAQDQFGATAIEYALIAAVMAVVILGGFIAVGDNLSVFYETVVEIFAQVTS
jgi:pilus assembly protein Flp/PilA